MDFEQAYDDHLDRVYAFFAYRCRSRADAEDLTQQTFERALKAWDRFDPRRAKPSTWLLAIARNLLIDHYRAEAPDAGNLPLEQVSPEAVPSADEVADLVSSPRWRKRSRRWVGATGRSLRCATGPT